MISLKESIKQVLYTITFNSEILLFQILLLNYMTYMISLNHTIKTVRKPIGTALLMYYKSINPICLIYFPQVEGYQASYNHSGYCFFFRPKSHSAIVFYKVHAACRCYMQHALPQTRAVVIENARSLECNVYVN